MLAFFITLNYTIDAIMLFYNAYVDTYYPAVLFIVLVPLFFAFGIFLLYSEDTTKEGRGRLQKGIILVIVSVVLIASWTIYYYLILYKYKDVYNGTGDKDDPENLKSFDNYNSNQSFFYHNNFHHFLVLSFRMGRYWRR